VDQFFALEASHRDGRIELPGGDHLIVTNLHKVFWPRLKLTKGDLFRYYARIAPMILPAVADRPLVMKRFPNGIGGQPFYQHRALEAPHGVRTEAVEAAARSPRRPQIIGGDLTTLLYMTQLASISQDPWFSRVATPAFADYAAFDLDPAPGVPSGACSRWRDGFTTSSTRSAPPARQKHPAPTGCTCTCVCRRTHRTRRDCSSARSWRRS